jgi:uncharacterized protein
MPKSTPPSALTDLEALDQYLMSDHAPEESMGVSDLDGFLTGIVVGPELIMPSEWLPVIWGGDQPEFTNAEEARIVLGTIMARYNEIIHSLDNDPENFDPVFLEAGDGQTIVADWAAGFLDATKLRPKAWKPLIKHTEARVLMMPLLVLSAEADEVKQFGDRPLPKEEVERLHANGAEVGSCRELLSLGSPIVAHLAAAAGHAHSRTA